MAAEARNEPVQVYRARFNANARRAGLMACAYFREQITDGVDLDAQRALLWQAMEVNYHYTQDWAMVVSCAQAGHRAMIRRGYWTQWGEHLTLALSAAQSLADPAAIAQLHYWLGNLRHRQGYWGNAVEHYTAAVEQYRTIGDRFWQPRIWRQLSEQLREQADWAQAEELAHRARAAQEQNSDAVGLAATYSALGHLAFRRNEPDEALQWLLQALAIPELVQDPEVEATVHSRLGNLYAQCEEFERAHVHYEASRRIATREGDESSLGTVLLNQAILYSQQGELTTSLELLLQAHQHYTHCGDLQGLALVHLNLSNTYLDVGQFMAAIAEGEKAIRLSRQLGDISSLCQALCNQAEWYYRLGNLTMASSLLDEATAVHQGMIDAAAEQIEIDWLRNVLLAAQGDYERALPRLRQILAQYHRYQDGAQLFVRLGDYIGIAQAAGEWAENADSLAQARALAQTTARTDFIGLVEQWAGDAAYQQGDWAQAQHHYVQAQHTFSAKVDERHSYLLSALHRKF